MTIIGIIIRIQVLIDLFRATSITPGTIEARGGDVIAQVIAWLDREAQTAMGVMSKPTGRANYSEE